MKYINVRINECDCDLLLEALKNKDLSILGEQSTDQIIWVIEEVLNETI